MDKPMRRALGFACLALALAGCNAHGTRGGVSGKVTLDGVPLEKGRISFQPIEGTESPTSGTTVENGNYSIPIDKGPMAGKYRVEINGQKATGKKVPAASPAPPGTMIDEVKEVVPPAFRGATSTLRAEIVAGGNTKDFEITSK